MSDTTVPTETEKKSRFATWNDNARIKAENRKYLYKQVRRGVKWTLIAGGVVYFAGKIGDKTEDAEPQPES